jgi:hypothetical protein
MRLESRTYQAFVIFIYYHELAPSYRPRLTAGRAARVIVPSPSLALSVQAPPILPAFVDAVLLPSLLPPRFPHLYSANLNSRRAHTRETCALHLLRPVCNGSCLPNITVVLTHGARYGQQAVGIKHRTPWRCRRPRAFRYSLGFSSLLQTLLTWSYHPVSASRLNPHLSTATEPLPRMPRTPRVFGPAAGLKIASQFNNSILTPRRCSFYLSLYDRMVLADLDVYGIYIVCQGTK